MAGLYVVSHVERRHVSGHEFTRAGLDFSRVINSLKWALFLTAVGWRAAPGFGAERLKEFEMTNCLFVPSLVISLRSC